MNNIIYGFHTVKFFLKKSPQDIEKIYLLQNTNNIRLKLIIKKIQQVGIVICKVNRKFLDKKANCSTHQGILALIKIKKKNLKEEDLKLIISNQKNPLFLILDNITDIHNFGACLRCADAAGVHAVITSRNHIASLNSVCKKVASGAAETVPLIRVSNLARTLRLLKLNNILIIGTDTKGNNFYYNKDYTMPLALVLGSENKGIRHLTRQYCDTIINIPMAGKIPSLNVSVAAGIFLFEIIRQRNL